LFENDYVIIIEYGYLYRYKAILNARRTNENENNSNRQVEYNRHYCDLTNIGPTVPGQEYETPQSSLFENDYVIIIEYLYGLFHIPP
jgi:hypothetical protein